MATDDSTIPIAVPDHLLRDPARFIAACYRLLVRAYMPDRGAAFDADTDQELLCDSCGATACGMHGCACQDVLCPHGREHLREAQDKLIVKRLRASVDPGPSEELEQLRREYKLARFVQIPESMKIGTADPEE